MLRADIEGVVEFTATHRAAMKALVELLPAGRFVRGRTDVQTVSHVERILGGQASGESGDFDPAVMATAVQRAIDGLPFVSQGRPGLLHGYGRRS